jgi:hypothetical protein
MDDIFSYLENEIEIIGKINDWPTKLKAMRKYKKKIQFDTKKTKHLMSFITKENIIKEELVYTPTHITEKEKVDLSTLVSSFNCCQSLEDKITIFNMITKEVKNIEKQLICCK